jgi:VanZ family protein
VKLTETLSVRNQKTYFLLAFLWTSIVTVLSLITISSEVGSTIKIEYKDKYVHFLFYFVFVVLWYHFATTILTKRAKLIVLSSAIGYGILMEICQGLFTTTRAADILDVLANSVGAVIGIIVVSTLYKNKKTTH